MCKFYTKDKVLVKTGDMVYHPSYAPTAIVMENGIEARIPMYDIVKLKECYSQKDLAEKERLDG